MRQARAGRWWIVAAAILCGARLALADAAPSVLYLLLDTTRADRLGAWGGPAQTPVLDALARRGAVFLRHYANSHATRSSMPQLMTGRYYHRNILAPFKTHEHPREYAFGRRDPTAALLPAILRARGYRTLGVSAHAWVVQGSDFGRQFDALEIVPFTAAEGHGDGAQVIDRAIALWQGRDRGRPLLLYLHLMDMHMPRPLPPGVPRPDGPAVERFTAGGEPRFGRERRRWARADASDYTADDRRYARWLYDQRLQYADAQIGRLLAAVEREDRGLQRTLVVVTADHGEELAEDGRVDHTQSLADAVQHVPWILAGGPVAPEQRTSRVTEHVDVLPTLLSVVGVPTPPAVRMDGRSQVGPDGRLCRSCGRSLARYAWEEYRALRGGHYLLREERPGSARARCLGREQLYRVAGGRLLPVSPDGPSSRLARALRRKLAAALDKPAGAFEAGRFGRANGSVLVRPEFWDVDGAALRCVPVDVETRPGMLREPGWLWTGRGITRGARPEPPDIALRARLPDGDYQVDLAAVEVPRPPRLFGYRRWLRKSFATETPGAFLALGRRRAKDGWLRVDVPAAVVRGYHVVGVRATPAGATPRTFGPGGGDGTVDAEQLERLRALGYVQ